MLSIFILYAYMYSHARPVLLEILRVKVSMVMHGRAIEENHRPKKGLGRR